MKIITEYPIWYLTLCVIIGLIYASLLYFRSTSASQLSKGLKAFVFVLRSLFISLIAALLLGILLKSIHTDELKPIIVFGQDNSESILSGPDSSYYKDNYQLVIDSMLTALAENYDVRYFTFGDDVEESSQYDFTEKQTNISGFLKQVENRFSNMNVGALILSSDGLYNKGMNPLYANRNLGAPIYTINMGDPKPRKDIKINKIKYNEITYLGNRFPVEVAIESYMCNGEVSTMQLFKDGKIIAEEDIYVEEDNEFEKKTFILEADDIGTVKYTCKLTSLKDEVSYANNTKNFFVEVIDSKQKIGIIYFQVHPDIAAVREAISKNENYDLDVLSAKKIDDINNLDQYDLLILMDPLTDINNLGIFKSIYDSNIPQLNFYGAKSKFGQVNRNLGFRNISSGGKSNVVNGDFNENFTLFKIDQEILDNFKDYPPLIAPFGRYTLSNNTNVLMNQKIGALQTKYPLIIFSDMNKKMASVIGEGVWRWRLHSFDKYQNHELFDKLIAKMVQFLALKEDKRKFRVEVNHRFLENERIEIKAELYNKNYELVNTPEVELSIKNEDDKLYKFTLNRSGDFYVVDIGYLPEGKYKYSAKTNYDSEELSSYGSFVVTAIQQEKTNITADHDLLFSLSERSGGNSFLPNDIGSIADSLQSRSDLKPMIFEKTDFKNVMDLEWLLFLILGLVGIEWLLRKQNGIF
jgi:hypothetical protein